MHLIYFKVSIYQNGFSINIIEKFEKKIILITHWLYRCGSINFEKCPIRQFHVSQISLDPLIGIGMVQKSFYDIYFYIFKAYSCFRKIVEKNLIIL